MGRVLARIAIFSAIPVAGLLMLVIRPRPPERPAGVPVTAAAFLQELEPHVWWWGQCEEQPGARYRCRLFAPSGAVTVSGEYVATARQCRGRSGSTKARLPYAGEFLELRRYETETGHIQLQTPCGVWLEPAKGPS
jgi:hypothetical protein